MPFLQTRPAEARTPEVEVLPDQRKRLTRFFRLTQTGEIPYGLTTTPGTPDPWPETAPPGFEGLLLTYKKLGDNSVLYLTGGKDPTPWVELIYEQIHPTDETPVGEPTVVMNQYGYLEVTYEWVQFSSSPFVPQNVGVTAAQAPWAVCILRDEEAPDDGTLRKIKRTYVEGGQLSDVSELRFGGALTIRTLKYLNEVPPLLAGYTLVGPGVEYINGLPLYSYQYARASGAGGGAGTGAEISRGYVNSQNGTDSFDPAAPSSGTGAVICTIRYVSTPAITVDPTTGPAGFVRFAVEVEDEAGYRLWTVRYGFGSGMVLDEKTTQATDALVVYHRVSLGTAPTAPASTLGGTVTLFEQQAQNDQGYVIFDYRWIEGDGQTQISTVGESDGAIVVRLATVTAAASEPASPGAGYFLISLTQEADGGYFRNAAIYKKPPVTVTYNKKIQFLRPGNASISGIPPSYHQNSPVEMDILAEHEVSYGVTQLTDVPFTVSQWATLYTFWTPVSTGITESTSKSLGGYLAGASGTSGTGLFNGVDCTSWEYQLGSSVPSSFTQTVHVIDVNNDPYLTDITGVVVFRRIKVSYDFS